MPPCPQVFTRRVTIRYCVSCQAEIDALGCSPGCPHDTDDDLRDPQQVITRVWDRVDTLVEEYRGEKPNASS